MLRNQIHDHVVEARVDPYLYKYKGGEEALFTIVAPKFSREKFD